MFTKAFTSPLIVPSALRAPTSSFARNWVAKQYTRLQKARGLSTEAPQQGSTPKPDSTPSGSPTASFAKPTSSVKSTSLLQRNKSLAFYMCTAGVAGLALSYASVPLYRMFCQMTGYGGTTQKGTSVKQITKAREITIKFAAHVNDALPWTFTPMQERIEVVPGETVLAFYEATNKTTTPLIGVATYNVTPMKVGQYFVKLQCFCFDEQRLNPKETVLMPVYFYIDPEINEDKNTVDVKDITLAYTFFLATDQNALEGLQASNAVEAAATR